MNTVFFRYLLKIGDDLLINAQRLCEWNSKGPFLEEDLALANISLDLFGQANAVLELAGRIENKGRDQDQLAFFRSDKDFLNAKIVEVPNGDYAQTMLKQAFLDSFRFFLYPELSKSQNQDLAGIAQKGIKEVAYHRRHTHAWVERFGNGTEESFRRLQKAMDYLWRYTDDLFFTEKEEYVLEETGLAIPFEKIRDSWMQDVRELLKRSNIRIPDNTYMLKGGRTGVHTEFLSYLLNEMQMLPRLYPDARW